MEQIGDILSRLAIQRNTRVGATATSSSRSQEPPCPRCGGTGFLRLDVATDDPRFGEIVPCQCKEREMHERRTRTLVARSNLSALAGMTFDNYLVDAPQRTAFTRARHFAENPEGWLIIMGPYGTGKTHLAAAIGNYRLQVGEPVLFQVVPDLLDHLRSAYAPGSETGYDEMFDSVRQAPLLILDDLGTQLSSQWAQEKLYQLFNHRYTFQLPTVFTTNNSLEEINPRLASRMADPQLSTCVTIDASDFRGGSGGARAPQSDRTAPRPRQGRRGRADIGFTDRL